MLRETTFVSAVCDRCGEAALEEDGDTLYCSNVANVFALVTDVMSPPPEGAWVPVAGVGLLCARCYAALRCAEGGHLWGNWRDCVCVQGFRSGGFLGACRGRARTCLACSRIEQVHPHDAEAGEQA